MRFLGEFFEAEPLQLSRGGKVVLKTDRGLELGEILCRATDHSRGFLHQTFEGEIVRVAGQADLSTQASLIERQRESLAVCRQLIADHHLQMDLIDVEAILGGERLIFYYLAEKRVDFRELVKDLARQFRTRIEMRQLGVRDEAKLLADYGDCGKPVCCNTHLTRMPPVTMRMAKIQKSTLDPAKISGRCGRLKCCLRYEFDTYQELESDLPPLGSVVEGRWGRGRVLNQDVLAQRLLVELDDRRRILAGVADVTRCHSQRDRRPPPRRDETAGPDARERPTDEPET